MRPQTAIHRLRRLYRDAHHCDPASDALAMEWAARPERWAEYQVRHRGWSWHAAEATVREARKLHARLTAAGFQATASEDPFDPLLPSAS